MGTDKFEIITRDSKSALIQELESFYNPRSAKTLGTLPIESLVGEYFSTTVDSKGKIHYSVMIHYKGVLPKSNSRQALPII